MKQVTYDDKEVTRNPSPSTPTNFTFTDGASTLIHVDDKSASISCDAGDAHLEAKLGKPSSWGGRGPMGMLDLLPGMPLFWFVHSLHSPVLQYKWTDKKTGNTLMEVREGLSLQRINSFGLFRPLDC